MSELISVMITAAEARQNAIFSRPDSSADLHKSFTCPKCSKSEARQGALANHVAVHHPELRGLDLVFYTILYNPESDTLKIDTKHPCSRKVEVKHVTRSHTQVAAAKACSSPKPRKRRNEKLLPAQRKRATSQGQVDLQQPPQPANTGEITELQRQLADAKAATAEAKVEIAIAKAEGLEKLLAERTRQEERYDQAQEVKNQQVNELLQVTKQQSETAKLMTKALVPDQGLIQVKSLEAMQKTSNEFHAFKNASR